VSYTYDLDTDVGLVRLELDDTTQGAGVKPDGSNFSDEELQVLLDREESVMRAAAAACEILARAWSRMASLSLGSRSEQVGQVAEQWKQRGQELRGQYGGASGAFSVELDREDGYSEEADTASDYTP
jgi:hypothetical protein